MKGPSWNCAMCLTVLLGWCDFAFAEKISSNDIVIKMEKMDIRRVRHNESSAAVDGVPPDNSSEWYRLTVEYIVTLADLRKRAQFQPEDLWIDKLEFEWEVVIPRTDDTGQRIIESECLRLKRTVTYRNVCVDGLKHHAVLYMEPNFLLRYKKGFSKDKLFIKINVKAEEKTKVRAWSTGTRFVLSVDYPASLYPRTRSGLPWFNSEEVKDLEAGLLTRLETPWAASSWNYYEHIDTEAPKR